VGCRLILLRVRVSDRGAAAALGLAAVVSMVPVPAAAVVGPAAPLRAALAASEVAAPEVAAPEVAAPEVAAAVPIPDPPPDGSIPTAFPPERLPTGVPLRLADLPASAFWTALAACESSGDWQVHSGNGFTGGVQDTDSTWAEFGGLAFSPEAWEASIAEQVVVNARVLAGQGIRAWPVCGPPALASVGGVVSGP
jgi:hypothetical protein